MFFGETDWGETPLGDPLEYFGSGNTLVALASGLVDPIFAVVAAPLNRATDSLETIRIATAELNTGPDDTPANTPFEAKLELAYKIDLDVLDNDGFLAGKVSPTFGQLKASNVKGELDDLLAYDWQGRDLEIYAGQTGQEFSLFTRIFRGTVGEIREDGESLLWEIAGLDARLDKPIQDLTYTPGLEPYGSFNGATSQADMGDVLDVGTGDFAIAFRFRCSDVDAGSQELLSKLAASLFGGNAGIDFSINTGAGNGWVNWGISDGPHYQNSAIGGGLADGQWHAILFLIDRTNNELSGYYDSIKDGASPVDISSVTGSLSNSAPLRLGNAYSGTIKLNGDLERVAFWQGSLPSVADALAFLAAKKSIIAQGWAGASSVWSFADAKGTTLTDDEGGNDGTLTSVTWSGTPNGLEALAGLPKPIWVGERREEEPVLIDATYLIYQLHHGAIDSILAAEDKGAGLTLEADHADFAALRDASLSSSEYATCIAEGLLRLYQKPAGQLTVWARGALDGDSNWISDAPSIARYLVATYGGLTDPNDLDVATFVAMAASFPDVVGHYTGTKTERLPDVLAKILGSIGAVPIPTREGLLSLFRLATPGAVDTDVVKQEVKTLKPETFCKIPWKARLGFQEYGVFRSPDSLATSLEPAVIADLGQAFRYAEDSDSSIQGDVKLSEPLDVETALRDEADAQAEATRRLALYGQTPRWVLSAVLPKALFRFWLGDVVNLSYPRYGLDAGKTFIVVGLTEDESDKTAALRLWGHLS